MEFDDDFSLLEPFGEFLVLSRQLLIVRKQLALMVGFAPSSPGSQTGENALLALLSPESQTRPIQALAAQQGSQLAGLMAGVGLVEDLELVVHSDSCLLALATTSELPATARGGEAGRTNAAAVPAPSARLGSLRSPALTFGAGTTGNNFLLEEIFFMKETFLPSTLI